MGAPSHHKLEIALHTALRDLANATPETLFAFLRPDRIEELASELAEGDPDRRVSATWIRKLASRHGGFDKAEFGRKMLERTNRELEALVEDNASAYEQAVSAVRAGGGREALGPAIGADLSDYLDDEDPSVRAQQRMYYLALAAADNDQGSAFRDLLARRYEDTQELYWRQVFPSYLEAYGRVLAEGVTPRQLQRAIAALYEGYRTHVRSGIEIPLEEMIDAGLRLFAAHSRRIDEPGLDPDRELFGRPRLDADSEPVSGSTLGAGVIHRSVVDAVLKADPDSGEIIRHAMLHTPSGSASRPRNEASREMAEAIYNHVRAGGELRFLVSLDTPGQLERAIEAQERLLGPTFEGVLTVRALIDAAPTLSPLIVGSRSACLAREGEGKGGVVGGVQLVDPASVELLTAAFDDTWTSPKTHTLIHESEPYPRGIAEAEARLTSLAAARSDG